MPQRGVGTVVTSEPEPTPQRSVDIVDAEEPEPMPERSVDIAVTEEVKPSEGSVAKPASLNLKNFKMHEANRLDFSMFQ